MLVLKGHLFNHQIDVDFASEQIKSVIKQHFQCVYDPRFQYDEAKLYSPSLVHHSIKCQEHLHAIYNELYLNVRQSFAIYMLCIVAWVKTSVCS